MRLALTLTLLVALAATGLAEGDQCPITINPGIGPKLIGWLAWLLALLGLKKARGRGD